MLISAQCLETSQADGTAESGHTTPCALQPGFLERQRAKCREGPHLSAPRVTARARTTCLQRGKGVGWLLPVPCTAPPRSQADAAGSCWLPRTKGGTGSAASTPQPYHVARIFFALARLKRAWHFGSSERIVVAVTWAQGKKKVRILF